MKKLFMFFMCLFTLFATTSCKYDLSKIQDIQAPSEEDVLMAYEESEFDTHFEIYPFIRHESGAKAIYKVDDTDKGHFIYMYIFDNEEQATKYEEENKWSISKWMDAKKNKTEPSWLWTKSFGECTMVFDKFYMARPILDLVLEQIEKTPAEQNA